MAMETRYLCQTYVLRKQGRRKQASLTKDITSECRDGESAKQRAERYFATGSYAGVDAVSIRVDPELGDYDDPVFLLRLGNVPEEVV